jgi:hypothetical protein
MDQAVRKIIEQAKQLYDDRYLRKQWIRIKLKYPKLQPKTAIGIFPIQRGNKYGR